MSRQHQKKRNIRFINAYKRLHPCKCGNKKNLTFHHRNPKRKFETISQLVRRGFSLKVLVKEVSKCDVVCENCHRRIHRKSPDPIKLNVFQCCFDALKCLYMSYQAKKLLKKVQSKVDNQIQKGTDNDY